jgi:dolichyl-phosphate beta-glucosyltransferase
VPDSPELSVIIPAFNEEERLGASLDRAAEYLVGSATDAEVIVVDDGSTDGTARVARERAGRFPSLRVEPNGANRGKGFSVRRGMAAARGRFLLFTDADFSTPIEEWEKVRAKLAEGFDVVIGSRSLPTSEVVVRQAWYREKMGRFFNVLVRLFALKGFIDTQCGFKAFTARAAATILPRMTLTGFGFDVEMLYVARKHGLAIAEVPVRWINSPTSRVRPIQDSLRMLGELLTIRVKDVRGRYR